MSNRRLSELEKAALIDVNGETTLNISGAGSGTQTAAPNVRLSQLQRNAFTEVNGQIAVRVTGTTGTGGTGLTTVEFLSTDWAEPSPADGTVRITLTHNLMEDNINLEWYETGLDGEVYVPWESIDTNTITACIPKNAAFSGEIRISAFVQDAAAASSFAQSFADSEWTQITGKDDYFIEFTHNLTSVVLEYSIYNSSQQPIFMCATFTSNEKLRLEANFPVTPFSGRITINREG